MRLIQVKVRCVEGVLDTGWIVPGKETTVFLGPRKSGKTSLLKALQALNPPYDISRVMPFSAHPEMWQQGSYSRRVIPEKKTAVFMVFAARPEQVARLAEIDTGLIETDRIEIGRRLDNSRWTSFVEISASSRWSEIAADMGALRVSCGDLKVNADETFFSHLQGSDRLQGKTAAECLHWLQHIEPLLAPEQRERYQQCLYKVHRRERFRRAEAQVAAWLPLTLYLDPGWEVPRFIDLSWIMNGRLREQVPVLADLLLLLCQQQQFPQSRATIANLLAKSTERMTPLVGLFRTHGWPFPVIDSDSHRIYFNNIPESVADKRYYLVAAACLLAQLCHEVRPLLLLDCFDRGLSGEEYMAMIRFQQQLGSWCQLLASSDGTTAAAAGGWQSVQQISPSGLGSSGLMSA